MTFAAYNRQNIYKFTFTEKQKLSLEQMGDKPQTPQRRQSNIMDYE